MAIDIDQSFYKTGTATVANGSTVVTGQGTLWTQTCRAGDLFGTHVGDGTRILSIESNTSLTLAYPWQGASQTTADYEIQFTPYDVGYQAAVRKLLTTLASGNIESFGELIGYAGGVPVFTGVGTLELVDKSEFVTPDHNGNLAELAAIAKQNDQFIVMGDDGSVQLMAISDITDAIATNTADINSLNQEKFNKPTGTTSQYLQGDGTVDSKTNLPISTATQTALNGKQNNLGYTPINKAGDSNISGLLQWNMNVPHLILNSPNDVYGWRLLANITDTINYGFEIQNSGDPRLIVTPVETTIMGNCNVFGALSKGSGTFLIDHPLDPVNKNLRHGFVESTEYLNLYRGLVTLENGRMSVDIDAAFGMSDGTFASLNADVMVTSLQNQNSFDRVCVEGDISSGKFTIICENESSTADIAWLVSGRRKDAFVLHLDQNCERGTGRFIPEYEKEDA